MLRSISLSPRKENKYLYEIGCPCCLLMYWLYILWLCLCVFCIYIIKITTKQNFFLYVIAYCKKTQTKRIFRWSEATTKKKKQPRKSIAFYFVVSDNLNITHTTVKNLFNFLHIYFIQVHDVGTLYINVKCVQKINFFR